MARLTAVSEVDRARESLRGVTSPAAHRVWVVGTGDDCDVRVSDEYASNIHAGVALNRHGYTIADLGSTNGTRIRRGTAIIKVVAPTRIYPGDTLIIGRSEIPWREDR